MATGLYIVGCALGGSAAGAVFGSCGWMLHWLLGWPGGVGNRMVLLAVALAALIGGLRDLSLLGLGLPQSPFQVPRYWLPVLGPYRTTFLWGLYIGAGVRTRAQYALLHVLALWVLLSGNPFWGAGLLGLYGATHGAVLALAIALSRLEGMEPMVQGVLGRTALLFALSGACLIAVGPMLLSQALR